MSERLVLDYLRARGQLEPPPGFVRSVMGAIEDAPTGRSWFGAFLPAAAVAGVVAVIALMALLLGPGRDLGPSPTAPPTPSGSAEVTLDDLSVALLEAVDVLRAAPGVEGRQQVEIDGNMGSATWFDWRQNGDQIVVQRHDLDVTETGWWLVPNAGPPTTGERIYTSINVKVGDDFFFTDEEGDWQVAPRDDGFPIGAFGPAILDGAILPWRPLDGLVPSLEDPSDARVQRDDLPDGGVEWGLEFEWMGAPLSQRWTIGRGGELSSWSFEREDRSVDPDGDFNANATHGWLQYATTDGAPIEPPDTDSEPDAADLGLPPDFPLGTGEGAIDYGEYVAVVLDAIETYHWDAANVDWATARSVALDGLPAEPDAAQAHQRIVAAIQTFDTFNTVFVRPADVPPPGDTEGTPDLPEANRIGGVAILTLPPFIGSEPDAVRAYLDAARTQMSAADAPEPACGWIVDVRGVAGGASGPLFAAVGGLLGEGRVVTFDSAVSDWWVDVDAAGTVSFGSEGAPSEILDSPLIAAVEAAELQAQVSLNAEFAREPPHRPGVDAPRIVLLTSSATSSAGEHLVIGFEGRLDTRIIGGVTAGSPHSLISLRMADGAVLRMPTATPVDRAGTRYSENIVPEDTAIGGGGGDAGIDAAVEWLESQPDCS